LLRQIAKFHCGLDQKHVRWLADRTRRVTPDRGKGMTPKNRERLRALIDLRRRGMLLNLPAELMRQAAAESRPLRAARLALRAVLVEILLICPLRVDNLRTLRIDRNLRRMDPSARRISHIFIPGEDVKNGEAIEWPVTPETAKLIQIYLDRYRPALADPSNLYLFPGEEGDLPLSASATGPAITVTICDNVGVHVNPHLLRHFAAWLYLTNHPGEYEIVRRILGHRSVQTTIDAYCGLESDAAARHYDSLILRERNATRKLAAAAFRPRRRKTFSRRKEGAHAT